MWRRVLAVSICLLFISSFVSADTFGTDANEFTIDFVSISSKSFQGSFPDKPILCANKYDLLHPQPLKDHSISVQIVEYMNWPAEIQICL